MSRPVTPGLLREWLKLKQEFVGVVNEALEQEAQVDRAITALQQLKARSDGSYTREELRVKQEDMDWAMFFRDKTLAFAVSIKEKMLTICKMDNMLRVCSFWWTFLLVSPMFNVFCSSFFIVCVSLDCLCFLRSSHVLNVMFVDVCRQVEWQIKHKTKICLCHVLCGHPVT